MRNRMSFPPGRLIGSIAAFLFLVGNQSGTFAGSDGGNRLYWTEVEINQIASSPELLALGKKTYETRCSACHGQSGTGDGAAAPYLLTKPRDFSKAQFKLRTTMDFPTDEDLFRTITVGFPAYAMPEFSYLSEEERWGLVYYVKYLGQEASRKAREGKLIKERLGLDPESIGPEEEAEHGTRLTKLRELAAEIAGYRFESEEPARETEPIGASPAAIELGRKAYVDMGCVKCHGETGHADGPSAETLVDDENRRIWARDFALSGWYFKAGDRPEDLVRVLITGMPGTPMPSFDLGSSRDAELWNLAHYVRFLATEED